MTDQKSLAANDRPDTELKIDLPAGLSEATQDQVAMAMLSPNLRLPAMGRGLEAAMNHISDDSPMAWVNGCLKGAYEAMIATLEEPTTKDWDDDDRLLDAKAAAAATFMICLPPITTKRRAQCFIACVAVGQQHGYIKGETARALLYTAQLALSAHGRPGNRKPHEGRSGVAE